MKSPRASRRVLLFAAGCSVSLLNCSRVPDTTEAVRQGVIRDLSKKVDVNNMDVNVASVSFRGKEADAMVSFSPKGQPGGGMSMRYTLEKKDDGWHIMRRQGDVAAHGSEAANGSELNALPGEGGQRQLPPNHPPIEGAPRNMPPAARP